MADRQFNAEEIAHALGHGIEKKNGDGSWNTVCPSHHDKGPSLTVTDGRNGKLLVHCHAKCEPGDVIEALKGKGLWPTYHKRVWTPQPHAPANVSLPNDVKHPVHGRPVKTWTYKTVDGSRIVGFYHRFDIKDEAGQIVRKELLPMCWGIDQDSKTGWCWRAFTEPRALYRQEFLKLPENRGKDVVLLEGEKTTDAAQQLLGDAFVCVCWPGGSKAIHKANFAVLKGRNVILWEDADAPGDKAMTSIAEILLDGIVDKLRRVRLPSGLPEGWDLADDVPDGVSIDAKALVTSAPDYRPMGEGVIEKMNRTFALVLVGDKTSVIWERNDEDGILQPSFISLMGFKSLFGNQFVLEGKTKVPTPEYWLRDEHRRTYHGVTFAPGTTNTPNYYNLWQGYKHDADPEGDWSLFEEHLRENVAQGNEATYNWIFAWFAQMFQQPRIKPGVSLVLRGPQGVGKTIVGTIMGELLKPHYKLVDSERFVFGQFNAHMASLILLHLDEAFWGGNPSHHGRLKSLVTSDTNQIEQKGKDSFEVDNYMRMLITSNSAFVVPASFEERRFAVFDLGERKMQDRVFFGQLLLQMLNGGYEGLMHALMTFDLKTVDLNAIPSTAALTEQKQRSLDTVAKFWFECLYSGQVLPGRNIGWPTQVSVDDFYSSYIAMATDWGDRRRYTQSIFAKELRDLLPAGYLVRTRMSWERETEQGYKVTVEGTGFTIPSLEEAREQFDKICRSAIAWPAADQRPVPRDEDEVPF